MPVVGSQIIVSFKDAWINFPNRVDNFEIAHKRCIIFIGGSSLLKPQMCNFYEAKLIVFSSCTFNEVSTYKFITK